MINHPCPSNAVIRGLSRAISTSPFPTLLGVVRCVADNALVLANENIVSLVIHHVFLYEEIDALLQRVVIIWNQHW
jgi:hypothetical protein